MTTIREVKMTEEQWLRQMRRDAVEQYKKDLADLLDGEVDTLMGAVISSILFTAKTLVRRERLEG